MATPVEADFYLTGATSDGGTQTDPDASLGSFRSSSEIVNGKVITAPTNITGLSALKPSITHDFKPVIAVPSVETECVLQLTMDGVDTSTTFTDLSASPHTVTVNGDAQVDTATDAFGGTAGVLLLDGTGDYLSIVDSADWHFAAGDFTIDCFIKTSAVTNQAIISQWETSTNQRSFRIVILSNVINVKISDDGTSVPVTIVGTTTVTDGAWHNVRVIRSGNIQQLYVDGIREGIDGTFTGASFNSTASLLIGAQQPSAPTNYFNGSIDDLFIVKGVAYTTVDFPVRTTPFSRFESGDLSIGQDFTLHLEMTGPDADTSFIDKSPNATTITANGDAQVDTAVVDPFGRNAGVLKLDGTGDYLSAADSTLWDFAAGDWRIDVFVKTSSTAAQTVIGQWDGGATNQRSWLVSILVTSGFVDFSGSSDGIAGGSVNIVSTTAVNDGVWHHIRVIRLGNAQMLFVDGTKEGTDGAFAGTLHNSTSAMFVGAVDPASPTTYFNGSISDLYLIKGAAISSINFTPRTKAIGTTGLVNKVINASLRAPTGAATWKPNGGAVLKQDIQFTANGETVRNTELPEASISQLAPSSEYTSFLQMVTGDGATLADQSIIVKDAVGVFTYTNTGTLLQYTAPGDTIGTGVNVGSDGTYTIRSANESLFVELTVIAASLPVSDQVDNVTITHATDNINNLFDSVTNAEASSGDTEYRALIVKNNQAVALTDFGVFIDRLTPSQADDVEIAIEEDSAILHVDCNGANTSTVFTDSSIYQHSIATTGNAQVDTSTDPFSDGNGSLKCDGTGDSADVADHSVFSFGTSDFTIEFWMKTSLSGRQISRSKDQNDVAWAIDTSTNKARLLVNSGPTTIVVNITGTTVTTDNAWHHIAGVKNGARFDLYVDGTSEGNASPTGFSINVPTTPLVVIGQNRGGSDDLNGNMDDIRIYNYAKYTANFTIPTTANTRDLAFVQTIANESTAPIGLTFSKPERTCPLTPIDTDLAVGKMVGVWVKRTIDAGGVIVPNNNLQLGLQYNI